MITFDELDAIRQFDTCTIADAIELTGVRLRNEGFTRPGLRCVTQSEPRLLGYAATLRVRSSEPPATGQAFLERTDWWEGLLRLPTPRVAVIQEIDPTLTGSCVGEVHSAVFKALGCRGVITNGAARDVPAVKRLGFPVFASAIAVSHSYTHVVGYGGPVEILGLAIHQGDLVYADCHGVVEIPHRIVSSVLKLAREIRAQEACIVDRCEALDGQASVDDLLHIVRSKS
jgi:4-hydroxy-4-methyl-2-oxoglutarate aldolase